MGFMLNKKIFDALDAQRHELGISLSNLVNFRLVGSEAVIIKQAEWKEKGEFEKEKICNELRGSRVGIEINRHGKITPKILGLYRNHDDLKDHLVIMANGKYGRSTSFSLFKEQEMFLEYSAGKLGFSKNMTLTWLLQMRYALDARLANPKNEFELETLEELKDTVVRIGIGPDGKLVIKTARYSELILKAPDLLENALAWRLAT